MDERQPRREVARLERVNAILIRALTEIAETEASFAMESPGQAIACRALAEVASLGPSSSTASSTASATRPGP